MPALGQSPLSQLRDRLKPIINPAKPGPLGITDDVLRAALKKNAGIYAYAAEELRCSRANVQQRVERSPELMAFVQEIKSTLGDLCEGGIAKLIKEGDPATLRWYAGVKLRDRGYSTKVDLVPPGGGPPGSSVKVTYEFVTPEARDDDPPEAGENDDPPV